jgi:hypothetical protein
MPNLIKISSAVLELFHVDRQTERQGYILVHNEQADFWNLPL